MGGLKLPYCNIINFFQITIVPAKIFMEFIHNFQLSDVSKVPNTQENLLKSLYHYLKLSTLYLIGVCQILDTEFPDFFLVLPYPPSTSSKKFLGIYPLKIRHL